MPSCRGVDIELRSQFDIGQYAEYYPREQSYYDDAGIAGKAPPFYDQESSTVSVYIEAHQGSQFWICYSILGPIPSDQFFLFKLFINSVPVVNWSCGEEEAWKGKTMFALFEREEEEEGKEPKKSVEKRAMYFTMPGQDDGKWRNLANVLDPNTCMEIRVFRAHGRIRVPREFQLYATTPYGRNERGISLVNAGRAGAGLPKRLYKFALIDPIDKPFVVFRYYYRTLEQLKHLGIFDHEDYGTTPTEGSTAERDIQVGLYDQRRVHGLEDVFVSPHCKRSRQPARIRQDTDSTRGIIWRRTYEENSIEDFEGGDCICLSTQPYQLSVPASLRFAPPKQTRPPPPVPNKKKCETAEWKGIRPAYPVEKWPTRTPSPARMTRDGISTPRPGRRKGFTAARLMGVVASAWKRRGMTSSDTVTQVERQL